MASNEGLLKTIRRKSIDAPPTMRIVAFGNSGPHQFSLTEKILQKQIFNDADSNTTLTKKTSGCVLERNVTFVNTPNLSHHVLSHDMLKNELKKSTCFSCPGPHAFLFVLHPLDLPSNVYDVFKPVVEHFGENILNHTIVVLYHEEELPKNTIEKKIEELTQKFGQKCFSFDGGTKGDNSSVTKQLFDRIDEMVSERHIFSNNEFKDADKRIKKEEKFIAKEREKEVMKALEALKKSHSEEDFDREQKLYLEKIYLENRERAELRVANRLGFTVRLMDYAAAVGKGAFVGAVLGLPMGLNGVVVGATVGAAVGVVLGGAAGAVWSNFAGITLLNREQ